MSIETFFSGMYEWDGYGFWGLSLSLFGFMITALAALSARKNAIEAAQAAREARRTVKSLDALNEVNSALAATRQIKIRISSDNWDRIVEHSDDIRVSLARALSILSETDENEECSILRELVSQVRTLARTAAKHASGEKQANATQVALSISDFTEKLAQIEVLIRRRIEP